MLFNPVCKKFSVGQLLEQICCVQSRSSLWKKTLCSVTDIFIDSVRVKLAHATTVICNDCARLEFYDNLVPFDPINPFIISFYRYLKTIPRYFCCGILSSWHDI